MCCDGLILGHGSAELRVHKVQQETSPVKVLQMWCRRLPESLETKFQVSYDFASCYMRLAYGQTSTAAHNDKYCHYPTSPLRV